ncbi:hypothetical protein LINPERPRIM_LOCUS30013 [Linum perenne]
MNRLMFSKLCELLVVKGGLVRSNTVDINEMVIMFLYTIAHNEKNRQLSEYLCRSGETISRNIHKVLRAMLKLNHILLKKPEPIPDNSNDVKWRHFKVLIQLPFLDYFPWNDKMDDAFISCLRDLVKEGHIENGSCKQGVFKEIENMMELKIKGCGVKALPHVRSRLTHFKKKFGAMHMMRSESGFGWNEAKQCIEVDDDVFKEYVKVTLFYVLFSVFCSAGVVVRWVWLAVSLGFGWNVDGIWVRMSFGLWVAL